MISKEAYEMMKEIWKDNPSAMFIVDGKLEQDVSGGVVFGN